MVAAGFFAVVVVRLAGAFFAAGFAVVDFPVFAFVAALALAEGFAGALTTGLFLKTRLVNLF